MSRSLSFKTLIFYLLLSLFSAVLAYFLGDSYGQRLPNHEGYYLVSVEDEITSKLPSVPRHTVLVVVDGLRKDMALATESVRYIKERGTCFTSNVGSPSVSRPVYSVISTGLEQDRTGSRNNDETSPLRAESIWEVARESGRKVSGVSELKWWQQLFPAGFDSYQVLPRYTDYFGPIKLTDLTLIHPVYIDEDGHDHGAASPEYQHSVFRRFDKDFLPFLQALDFSKDLLILTADHGHTDRGGHGGNQPEVVNVLTCFVGKGVKHDAQINDLDTRSIAPVISLLSGLRFPENMRVIKKDQNTLFSLLSFQEGLEEYQQERKLALSRYQTENQKQLQAWLGTENASWELLYQKERAKQYWKMGIAVFILFFALFLLIWREKFLVSRVLYLLGFLCMIYFTTYLLYFLYTGSFDFTSINSRADFIQNASFVSIIVGILGLLLYGILRKNAKKLLEEQSILVGTAIWLNVSHIFIYGWPLGFPVPSPFFFFLPYIGSVFLLWHSIFLAILSIAVFWKRRGP